MNIFPLSAYVSALLYILTILVGFTASNWNIVNSNTLTIGKTETVIKQIWNVSENQNNQRKKG